jgi:hypothetical protein
MATIAVETQPSFYYMLIAQTCFQRSQVAADQVRSQALRDAARGYLAKAGSEIVSRDEPRKAA